MNSARNAGLDLISRTSGPDHGAWEEGHKRTECRTLARPAAKYADPNARHFRAGMTQFLGYCCVIGES